MLRNYYKLLNYTRHSNKVLALYPIFKCLIQMQIKCDLYSHFNRFKISIHIKPELLKADDICYMVERFYFRLICDKLFGKCTRPLRSFLFLAFTVNWGNFIAAFVLLACHFMFDFWQWCR